MLHRSKSKLDKLWAGRHGKSSEETGGLKTGETLRPGCPPYS